MTQSPTVNQLVPLQHSEDESLTNSHWDYIYEPEAKELLDGRPTILWLLVRRYNPSDCWLSSHLQNVEVAPTDSLSGFAS